MQKGSRLRLAWAVNVAKAKTQLKDAELCRMKCFMLLTLGGNHGGETLISRTRIEDSPGGPGVKTLPTKAGSVPLVPGRLTKSHMLHSMAKRFKKKKKKNSI